MNPTASATRRNPWAWIPSLYFAQGIPYVVVMTLSTVMYKNLGLSNTDIALYTSWLYLPWVIKPLWSPLVDLFRTKRFWIVTLQFTIAIAFALVAFTLPGPKFFQLSLAVFWLLAFSSATHDIAADGFYLLAMKPGEQAAFVGVRSTFYRLASLSAQGGLVYLAGMWTTSTGSVTQAWSLVFGLLAASVFGVAVIASLDGMVNGPRAVINADLQAAEPAYGTIAAIGEQLFRGNYLLPFEAVSLLLTVSMIGAVILAKREV